MLFSRKKYCFIPADIPRKAEKEFCQNYAILTQNTGKLFMFACDQKIEHLNKDFYGNKISPEALNPEHMFNIASGTYVGAFATHLGLIARYGKQYPTLPYIAKLNGKTDLIPHDQKDPRSLPLWTVSDVLKMKEETGISIRGVGYTIYLGSEYESEMMAQAAQIIHQAHQFGLLTVIWIYARGKAIKDDQDPQLIAGACGIAASLGADFVKVKPPRDADQKMSSDWLAIATAAAGNTQVICSGGEQVDPEQVFKTIFLQLNIGKTTGCAIGRNIFQRSLHEANAMTRTIGEMIHKNISPEQALTLYNSLLKK